MQAVVEAKAAENARQQRVLQTQRVKNILYNARIHALFIMTKMSQLKQWAQEKCLQATERAASTKSKDLLVQICVCNFS